MERRNSLVSSLLSTRFLYFVLNRTFMFNCEHPDLQPGHITPNPTEIHVTEPPMSNKFKAALAATSLAGAIIATGAEIDVDGFEVDIIQNQAVAEIVSGVVTKAKPVEPYLVIALGGNRGKGGEGGRGDAGNGENGDGGGGGGIY